MRWNSLVPRIPSGRFAEKGTQRKRKRKRIQWGWGKDAEEKRGKDREPLTRRTKRGGSLSGNQKPAPLPALLLRESALPKT